jgi:tRNA threonylcarbamoyladenosine biosynthesis protein TsaB
LTRILAIDTSTAWCSVALSLDDFAPILRHELVSAGASQLLLPWVEEVLNEANLKLTELDAIAIGIGPGAFTGVRLGVAAVQGLAISNVLPVLPVASLDAVAAQLSHTYSFEQAKPKSFVIALDARMDEIYWAKYETTLDQLPIRIGEIHLSNPQEIDFLGVEFLAGSALKTYGERLISAIPRTLPTISLDPEIHISALGILECAQQMYLAGQQCHVRDLEPLYIRNKVALTTQERTEAFK